MAARARCGASCGATRATRRSTPNALVREEYRGIRPAPGYPACPDHAVKAPLFELLRAESIGMALTESFAMLPTAAVAGFYFRTRIRSISLSGASVRTSSEILLSARASRSKMRAGVWRPTLARACA